MFLRAVVVIARGSHMTHGSFVSCTIWIGGYRMVVVGSRIDLQGVVKDEICSQARRAPPKPRHLTTPEIYSYGGHNA